MFNIDKSRKGINPFQREWFAQVIAALRSEGCARTKPPGLNSSYAPDKFIGDLDHALMRLADPKDIVAVTVRMLGQYTGVDRCDYAEVEADQDYFVILGDYTKAATNTISGRYRMSDFGETEWKGLLENHAYVVNDIEAEPLGNPHSSISAFGSPVVGVRAADQGGPCRCRDGCHPKDAPPMVQPGDQPHRYRGQPMLGICRARHGAKTLEGELRGLPLFHCDQFGRDLAF